MLKNPARSPMSAVDSSLEEKVVWIALGGMLVVFGGYFAIAGRMMLAGVTTLAAFVPLFIVTVALFVAVMVIATIVTAAARRPEGRDERDQIIEWRSESGSGWVLGAGVIASIAAMIVGVPNVWVAHLLLFSLFLSEVLKMALQLYFYRRGT